MATGNLRATGLSPEVDAWLDALDRLVADVEAWAGADGWETRRTSRHMNEANNIRYEVPILELDRSKTWVALVPVIRLIPGADGLVDFYLMPDFDSVASLYWQEGRWFCHYVFHSESMSTRSVIGADRLLLDDATLHRVLNDMAAHA